MTLLERRTDVPPEPAASIRRSRYATAAAVLLIVGSSLIAWLARSPAIGTRQDDAAYIILAESLAQGEYRESWHVSEPAHSKYPPGYPAALLVWDRLTGGSYDGLVLLSVISLAGMLACSYIGARRVFGEGPALAGLAVISFNPYLIQYAGEIASEPIYMFLTLVALVGLTAAGTGRMRLAAVAAAAIVATLSRAVGVALLAALLVHWLLERRWRVAAMFVVACTLTVGAWFVWTAIAPPESATGNYLRSFVPRDSGNEFLLRLIRRPIASSQYYVRELFLWTIAFPTVRGTPIDNILGLLAGFGGIAVGLIAFWRRWRPALLYVVFYTAILLEWWGFARLLVPLLPLILPAMIGGLYLIGRRFRPAAGIGLAGAMTLALAVNGAALSLDLLRQRSGCAEVDGVATGTCLSPDQESYFEALRYLRASVPGDAVVYTAKPETMYLISGHRSPAREPTMGVGRENFLDELRQNRVGYILAGALQVTEEAALPERIVQACEELALEAFFPPRTYIFQLDGGSAGPANACAAAEQYRAANEALDLRSGESGLPADQDEEAPGQPLR